MLFVNSVLIYWYLNKTNKNVLIVEPILLKNLCKIILKIITTKLQINKNTEII